MGDKAVFRLEAGKGRLLWARQTRWQAWLVAVSGLVQFEQQSRAMSELRRKVTSIGTWQKTWQKKTAEEREIVQEIAGH